MMQTSKPLSPAAAALLAEIEIGTVLYMPKKDWIAPSTVSEITEKSVKFSDGTFAAKRSLANFAVKH
jgi:hypothetical protein